MTKKRMRVVLSIEAEAVFNEHRNRSASSKVNHSIFNSITKKTGLVRSDPHYGDPISKKQIPLKYIDEYGITNLFRVELSNYYRLLYTLVQGDTPDEIIVFVLDIIDHKKYDKIFGYRKK